MLEAASAQDVIATVSNNPWEGFFVGANIGGAWNHTCQRLESLERPSPAAVTPALANAFYNRDCPNNGNFIGGVDFGYNFQIDQWVWGFKADYDAVGSKTYNRSYNVYGQCEHRRDPVSRAARMRFNGKVSPNGIWPVGSRGSATRSISGCRYFRAGGGVRERTAYVDAQLTLRPRATTRLPQPAASAAARTSSPAV